MLAVYLAISSIDLIPFRSMSAAENAVTDSGTSCRISFFLRAVTVISSICARSTPGRRAVTATVEARIRFQSVDLVKTLIPRLRIGSKGEVRAVGAEQKNSNRLQAESDPPPDESHPAADNHSPPLHDATQVAL